MAKNNGDLLKEIHENMIVFKEFAKNTDKRVCDLEKSKVKADEERQILKIQTEKNDWWSKTKTFMITGLSGACGYLLKALLSH